MGSLMTRPTFAFVIAVVVSASLARLEAPAAEPLLPMPPLVPGTGVPITRVGDDFEDDDWSYDFDNPKSSSNIDKHVREPIGISANERIFESTYRGHPDVVKRVATPPGGIQGSRGALLMRTRATGVPGRRSNEQQQDDLMVNVYGVLGHEIGPEYSPSCTVRVYLPPWDKWEQRSGASFGFRMDCEAWDTKRGKGWLLAHLGKGWQQYWPGMFIVLQRKEDGFGETHARLLLRADPSGRDIEGPIFKTPGWYTLGMSVTPNGQVHYYASKGVDELTPANHIDSQFPYNFKCERFNLIFFNVVNIDDGRTWSTPWIVDDPAVYYMPKGWTTADLARYRAKKKKEEVEARARTKEQAAQTAQAEKPARRTSPAVGRHQYRISDVSGKRASVPARQTSVALQRQTAATPVGAMTVRMTTRSPSDKPLVLRR